MTDTGGPAFPTLADNGHAMNQDGMTLRDYFAAKIVQAQVGNPLRLGDDEAHRLMAERAYRVADAMLAERSK